MISRAGALGSQLATCSVGPPRSRPGPWRALWPMRAATASMRPRRASRGAVAVPNWVGTDQQRSVELSGDRLTLSASPLLPAGTQQVPRLVWERVGPFPRGQL